MPSLSSSVKSDNQVPGIRRARGYVVALALVLLAALLRVGIVDPLVGDRLPYITFFAAVFAVAWFGAPGSTLFTVALSALAAGLLVLRPLASQGGPALALPGTGLFLAVGLGVAALAEARRRSAAQLRAELEENQRLRQVAEDTAVEAENAVAEAEESLDQLLAAEQELRASEERLRAALRIVPLGVFTQDRELRYTWYENSLDDGRGPAIIGRQDADLMDPADAATLERIKRAVLTGGRGSRQLVEETRDGERRAYDLTLEPLRDRTGAVIGLVGATYDVTERRRRDAREQEARRLEAIGRLAGGVAHEANNQMSVVLGAAHFLLADAELSPSARSDVDQIRRAAERTAAVTAQLLAFGRRQLLHPAPLDLGTLVTTFLPVVRRSVGAGITVEATVTEGVRVLADAGQLEQVLLNLALNSRDAMPHGGRIALEVDAVSVATSRTAPSGGEAVPPGRYAQILVKDDGAGMSRETLARVFEPFFTTKEVGKGSGLGLAMVYGIVRQSGGYILATSSPGEGACFEILLPLTEAELVSSDTAVAPRAQGSERVLVVDDDAGVLAVATRALTESGYAVVAVSSAEAALLQTAHAARAEQPFSIVVSDLILGGMDGAALLTRLSQEAPSTRVLLMSGFADEARRRATETQAYPVLLKPFAPDELLQRVRGSLDGAAVE